MVCSPQDEYQLPHYNINKKIKGSIKQIGNFKTDVIIMKIFGGTGSMGSPQCLINATYLNQLVKYYLPFSTGKTSVNSQDQQKTCSVHCLYASAMNHSNILKESLKFSKVDYFMLVEGSTDVGLFSFVESKILSSYYLNHICFSSL